MTFPASCIRFGPIKVEPIQDVQFSKSQLTIVFRKNESSTKSVTFHAYPAEFPKTVYNFHKKSSTILFRLLKKQLECIASEFDETETGKHFLLNFDRCTDFVFLFDINFMLQPKCCGL